MTTDKQPSQNSIGRALGLSSASMAKLKKIGMPTDTVKAASNWREQNLHPGRTKTDWPGVVAAVLGVSRESVLPTDDDQRLGDPA